MNYLALIALAVGICLFAWAFTNTGGRLPLNGMAIIGGSILTLGGGGYLLWRLLASL